MNSKWTTIQRAVSSFVISTCELSWVVGMSAFSIGNFVVCFRNRTESTMFYQYQFFKKKKNCQLTRSIETCIKALLFLFITQLCDETQKQTRLIKATTSERLSLMRWNLNWSKVKHEQTSLLWSSRVVPSKLRKKKVREFHIRTLYACIQVGRQTGMATLIHSLVTSLLTSKFLISIHSLWIKAFWWDVGCGMWHI